MNDNADTKLLLKTKLVSKQKDTKVRVKLKNNTICFGEVVLDEVSLIRQEIRRPCKCQLAVTPPWGMGLTVKG